MSRFLVGVVLVLLLTGQASAQKDTKKKPPTDKQVVDLIAKLGDARFEVRNDAYKTLVAIGRPVLPHLRKVARSEDLEIQMRVRKIIKEIEAQPAPRAGG